MSKTLKEAGEEYSGLIDAFLEVSRLKRELRQRATEALVEYRRLAREQRCVVTRDERLETAAQR